MKVCKFCSYASSLSFSDFFLLIFHVSTVQWINCGILKDEQHCSYNGGGDAYLLKKSSDFSSIQYIGGAYLYPLQSVAILFNIIIQYVLMDKIRLSIWHPGDIFLHVVSTYFWKNWKMPKSIANCIIRTEDHIFTPKKLDLW